MYDVTEMKVVKAALQLTQITLILLGWVDLGDDGLVVTANMVLLYVVHMSAGAWGGSSPASSPSTGPCVLYYGQQM